MKAMVSVSIESLAKILHLPKTWKITLVAASTAKDRIVMQIEGDSLPGDNLRASYVLNEDGFPQSVTWKAVNNGNLTGT